MTQLKQKRDLFSVKVKKERKGGKKKGKKQTGDKTIKVKKAKKEDRLSSLDVEPLTYKSLAVGQVVLGCICEVRDYGLVVSLPHKLMGSVSLAHISRPYTALLSKLKDDDDNEEDEDEAIHALQELYTCGQYVVASVVAVAKENNMTKVSLTLMPNEVNFGIPAPSLAPGLVVPCAVSSVEDKGYVLDTGIAGISAAFMKKEHTAKAGTLGVGSVLRCIITNVYGSDNEDNLRLTFSADPKAVSAATLDLSATTNMALLLPGTAVNTTISKVRHDAVTLMLADLDGVVSPLHLAQPFEQLQQYSLGDSVRARVLYVTPLSKVVHLTLQKTVCSKRSVSDPLQGLECGNIVHEAEIYKTSASGIYVRLNAKTRGFCSGNHLSDKNKVLKHITRDFPVGKKHTCRLIKYNFLDQLFIVSLQKSVLEQQFVSYSELAPGQVVEATVSGYEETGARLAVSKVISGHVPALHLTNNPVKHPQRKHPLGQQVTARVLKVNPKRHHLLLTLKSRLVNAQEPIVTQYTREAENTITVGYVIKIIPSGLLVGMFNDVKGFVPKSQAGVPSSEDLAAVFREGQVVRCRVIKVSPDKKHMTLTLRVDAAKPSSQVARMGESVEVRSRVLCVVDEVKANTIKVTLTPNNTEAVIPVHHLSDDPEKCRLLKELIREKDQIVNAVVFSKSDVSITLSLKSSACFWVQHGSSEVLESQELVAEESYPAVVSAIKSFGIFVMIPLGSAGKRALVHQKNLTVPGKWIDIEDMGIRIGQSLYVSFKDTDDKGRPILTTALKDNLKNATQSSLQVLYSYLKTEQTVARGLVSRGGQDRRLAKYGVGDKVAAVVTEVTPQGVSVRVKSSGVLGTVAATHQYGKTPYKAGQRVKACVLHVNQEDKCLELTLRPKLMLNIHANKTEKLTVGMKVKCEVVLAKDFFTAVVMKSACQGTVAYLPSLMHLNCFSERTLNPVGRKVWVVVKHIEGALVLAVLKCHNKDQHLSLDANLPEIVFSPSGEGETGSEEEEEATSSDQDSDRNESHYSLQGKQSNKEEMEHANTVSPRPGDSNGEIQTQQTAKKTKKREIADQKAKKSKKLKTGKAMASKQGREEGGKAGSEVGDARHTV